MENGINFDELSQEYPLFFSSSKNLLKEKYYPSPKSPKPISEESPIFLDYDDYILDESISKLAFYHIETKANKNLNRSLEQSIPNNIEVLSTNEINSHFSKKISQIPNKSSAKTHKSNKKRKTDITLSKYNFESGIKNDSNLSKNNVQLQNDKFKGDFKNLKETGAQTPWNVMKKKVSSHITPSSQSLHSGYPVFFDYQPKLPQRHQKLHNGTEKIFYQNGDILVLFTNGKEKIYHQNIILTKYKNGDILQEFLDGATAYKYGKTGTIELTLPDHTSIIQYPNGQREKRNPEGETIVKFSDGVFMKIDPEGNWSVVKSQS